VLDPRHERRLFARSLAVVFFAGPTVFLSALAAAPPPDHGRVVALLFVAGGAYLVVPPLLLFAQRLPRWAPDALYAFGAGLVTAVIAITATPTSPYAFFYLWLSLHAAYFLTPRRLAFHVALVCLFYAGASYSIDGTAEFARWIVTSGTLALIAGLVKHLARRADRLVLDLHGMASTDSLTQIGNRRALEHDLHPSSGPAASLRVAMFDLDGFKGYNDRFGHAAGDALLRRLAARLAGAVAPGGTAYRVGGDEFCVVLPATVDNADAIIAAARAALIEHGDGWSIAASCGVSIVPDESADPWAALRLADSRMYACKHGRRHGAIDARDVLMQTLQEREPSLYAHVNGVKELAARIGPRLGLAGAQLEELLLAAELHDIGKVAIPDAILGKPGPLDAGEWEYVRQHTIVGERILAESPALLPVARLVRSSHERWDGCGYPDRLAGAEIPLGARVLTLCDAFDAMLSDRPYRRALSLDVCLAELRRCSGTQFDPAVVAALEADAAAAAPPAVAPAAA